MLKKKANIWRLVKFHVTEYKIVIDIVNFSSYLKAHTLKLVACQVCLFDHVSTFINNNSVVSVLNIII